MMLLRNDVAIAVMLLRSDVAFGEGRRGEGDEGLSFLSFLAE